MTTTQPAPTVNNPGAEEALEAVLSLTFADPYSELADWALSYLCVLVPATHPARRPVEKLITTVAAVTSSTSQITIEAPTLERELLEPLRTALNEHPIPVQVITTADEFAAFRAARGLRGDWHEPDEQNITTKTSPGTFDNASLHPYYLEQSVFFYDTSDEETGPVPVAAANLAALCSWATGYGR